MAKSRSVHHGRCEAPGCTAPGRFWRPEAVAGSVAGVELRDRLCLCRAHYRAIADGLVGCWGEPPLDVVWRLGRGDCATWYHNERRLSAREIETWLRDAAGSRSQ